MSILSVLTSKIYYIFLIIPLLFLLTGIYLQNALGFHFLGSHIDPDYAYLFNSLAISQSFPVGHTDHPGTPMQILGSMVIKISFIFRGQNDLVRDVLANPETYINIIIKTVLILNSFLLFIAGVTVFKMTKKILPAFLLQLTPFLSLSLISSPVLGLSAEPLLLFSGILFLLPVFLTLFKTPVKHQIITLLFSVAAGLGIATKIIFAPLIFVPLFALSSLKERLAFILGTIISFYFFTQPIVPQYQRLFNWIKDLLTHSGRHGTGDKTIIDQAVFITNMKKILADQYIITILLTTIVLIIIAYLWRYGVIKNFKKNLAFRLLVGLFVTEIIQIIMVAKHPGGQYLIPGTLLLPAIIITSLFLISKFEIKNFLFVKHLSILILCLIIIFQLYKTISQIPILFQAIEKQKNVDKTIYNEIQSKYKDDTIITYFRSSSPFYALRFGNTFVNFSFNHYLKSIYPNTYFWDIWNGVYTNWDSQVTFQDIINNSKEKDIIFHGTSFEGYYKDSPQYKPKLPLIDVFNSKDETIYKVDLSKLDKE